MSNVLFTGVMPALVTPLCEDETIDERAARRIINWHIDRGMSGFYALGATGEGPVVQTGERMRLAEIARDETRSRAKLILHVGAIDLKTAVSLAKHAGEIGADAISSVPPFFFGYGEKEIAQYYTALSDASGLPLIMYCSPLSGVNITCDMVERFLNIPGAIGVKWTSYDYYSMHKIKELRAGDVNVLNGPDECLLCGLAMGADGGIGATYNAIPKVYKALYDAFAAGDLREAQKQQYKANAFTGIMIRFGVHAAIKETLARIGFACGKCVYPMRRLTDDERSALNSALDELKFEANYL